MRGEGRGEFIGSGYARIVVPLDGSEFGERALPVATAIAKKSGAGLGLVTVCDTGSAVPEVVEQGPALAAESRKYLEDLATRLFEDSDVDTELEVLAGPVVDSIVEEIRRWEGELVVLSTHGRGPVRRIWLGSVADRLVRRSPVPLLLVRPREGEGAEEPGPSAGEAFDPSHVLVPLDGSPVGEAVLEEAVRLGGLFGARFTLFRAVSTPEYLGTPYLPHVEWIDRRRIMAELEERARKELRGVADRMRRRDLETEASVVRHDHPADAILEFAEAEGADLIAMGTHGRGAVARTLLGAVADKVVRGASAPVLLVRAGEA